jgi:acetyltransferase-like isoleucine patch superfamily enzyme
MPHLEEALLRIRRRDSRLTDFAYRAGKALLHADLPAPKALYEPLYYLRRGSRNASDWAAQKLYYQPMFRARCESCGDGLQLYLGIPYLYGDLRMRVGANCKINGVTSFVAGKVLDRPTLTLGDNTNIGYGVVISVSESITLGHNVRVADRCFITDNPGHPLDAKDRREGLPPPREAIRPVVIEADVWLGTGVTVLPGVTIGRGSVIGAGSVVTRDVPPYTFAAGNPAKPVRALAANDVPPNAEAEDADPNAPPFSPELHHALAA